MGTRSAFQAQQFGGWFGGGENGRGGGRKGWRGADGKLQLEEGELGLVPAWVGEGRMKGGAQVLGRDRWTQGIPQIRIPGPGNHVLLGPLCLRKQLTQQMCLACLLTQFFSTNC